MARVVSVDDLIQEIREQADEHNTSVLTDAAIVRVLNRGLRFITSELARAWPEPLLARAVYSVVDYTREVGFPFPWDIFEDRATQVQTDTPNAPTPIKWRSYTQISSLDIRPASVMIPDAVYQRAGHFFLVPSPGPYDVLLDYIRLPDPMTQAIGRINTVGVTYDSVTLDSSTMNLDLVSVSSDDRKSYVNLVHGMTGEILCTRQVQRIDGSKVTFRSVVTRGEIEGRVVAPSFDGVDVEVDWYLCPVVGTCVPQHGQIFVNYLTQYAVAEIGRSLGDTLVQISKAIEERAQAAAEQQRQGRPNTLRVKNTSTVWGGVGPIAYPYSRR